MEGSMKKKKKSIKNELQKIMKVPQREKEKREMLKYREGEKVRECRRESMKNRKM